VLAFIVAVGLILPLGRLVHATDNKKSDDISNVSLGLNTGPIKGAPANVKVSKDGSTPDVALIVEPAAASSASAPDHLQVTSLAPVPSSEMSAATLPAQSAAVSGISPDAVPGLLQIGRLPSASGSRMPLEILLPALLMAAGLCLLRKARR
jgi:hypothetical protein